MLRKTLSLNDAEIKLEGDTGRFAGYASVFGGVDSYGDTIIRGAYESTLRANGKPKMFFNHASYDLPIGKWLSAKEDEHGLFVEGELTLGNPQSDAIRAALKHGTVDGLSIGYYLKKGDFDETEDGRVIRKVSKLVEVSVVTFPADDAARVDLASIKSEDIEAIESIKDFERLLREVGPFSRDAAKHLIAKARTLLATREAEPSSGINAAAEAKALAIAIKHY